MNYKIFYKELGKLLYAIAKADGSIQIKESSMIRQIIKEEFVPLEDTVDEFGSDAAFYAEFEIEALDEVDENVENAFFSFLSYMKQYSSGMDPRVSKLCINAVQRVAEAYRGVTRVEQQMVDVLRQELAKL